MEDLKRQVERWIVSAKWARADANQVSIQLKSQDETEAVFHFTIGPNHLPFQIEYQPHIMGSLSIRSSCPGLKPWSRDLNRWIEQNSVTTPVVPISGLLTKATERWNQDKATFESLKWEEEDEEAAEEGEEGEEEEDDGEDDGFEDDFEDDFIVDESEPENDQLNQSLSNSLLNSSIDNSNNNKSNIINSSSGLGESNSSLSSSLATRRKTTARQLCFSQTIDYLNRVQDGVEIGRKNVTRNAGIGVTSNYQRLLSEFKLLSAQRENGIEVKMQDEENLFSWIVSLSQFTNPTLHEDLKTFASVFNTKPVIQLSLKFPSDFPASPPLFAVMSPRFEYMTRNITFGGTICMNELTNNGWRPTIELLPLILQVKQNIEESNIRINFALSGYRQEEAIAAHARLARIQNYDNLAAYKFRHFFFATSSEKLPFGNRINLPMSALDELQRDPSFSLPITFELVTATGIHTHCSVLEFTAEEGTVELPTWMMQNLSLIEGAKITLQAVNLPRCESIKLQPHSSTFIVGDEQDTLSIISSLLTKYAALTLGDTIHLQYYGEEHHFDVLELKPHSACSLVDAGEVKVDFTPPLLETNE
jgi:ubiquitin-protein ligase